ncbi:MAG: hypothetical protein ACRCZO_10650 [Cetobacterium sp.]
MLIASEYNKDIFTCFYCNGNNQHTWDTRSVTNDGRFTGLTIGYKKIAEFYEKLPNGVKLAIQKKKINKGGV